jgi:drug/metabolite transporter (DMT)-like permease
MIYFLLASIFFNSLLFFILKYFDRFGVNTFQGIVVNYLCAGSLGLLNNTSSLGITELPHVSWLWIVLLLGALFISIFILLAKTAQQIGVSVASVANKMSVIIPVTVAILFYRDSCSAVKITGIVLALAAVYLTSKKNKDTQGGIVQGPALFLLPFTVFLGSGIIDALVNFAQQKLIHREETSLFIAASFGIAGIIGLCLVFYRIFFLGERFALKSLIGGILLGIPNFFSLYFMVKALNAGGAESSVLYPINNMGIVVVSAAGGLVLFREKLSLINLAGILLSILAIALITFA